MTEVELDVAHFVYEMPHDIHFYRSDDSESADQPPKVMIVVHEASMDSSLHFPLHPTISHLLATWCFVPA